MAHRQVHLNSGPVSMAMRTACGRNILRTPISTNWAGFLAQPTEYQCIKCAKSKQAEVNRRQVKVAA